MRAIQRDSKPLPVRGESGLTMIEVLVAVVILTIGLVGLFTVFDNSRNLTSKAYGQAAATKVAERELESVVSLGYSNIGLSTAPVPSSSSSSPNYYVTSGGQFEYDWTDPTVSEPFCVATVTGSQYCPGTVSPGPTAWNLQGIRGNIYRFVTWVDDPCGDCNGRYDYKRITIAVTVTPPSAETAQATAPGNPILVSTLVTNPNAGPGATG